MISSNMALRFSSSFPLRKLVGIKRACAVTIPLPVLVNVTITMISVPLLVRSTAAGRVYQSRGAMNVSDVCMMLATFISCSPTSPVMLSATIVPKLKRLSISS